MNASVLPWVPIAPELPHAEVYFVASDQVFTKLQSTGTDDLSGTATHPSRGRHSGAATDGTADALGMNSRSTVVAQEDTSGRHGYLESGGGILAVKKSAWPQCGLWKLLNLCPSGTFTVSQP